MSPPDEIPHMDLPTLAAFVTDLEAKFAQQAAVRTTPAPSRPLRQERLALWRIAMLCKDALASPALPPEGRPYFVQIARVCRAVVQRQEGDSGDHGT